MAWSIVIANQDDMELVATPATSKQFLDALNSHAPHVILADEDILNRCDQQALLASAARLRPSRLILVAMHQPDYSIEPSPFPWIHARLLKGVSAPELLETIRSAAKEAAGAAAPRQL